MNLSIIFMGLLLSAAGICAPDSGGESIGLESLLKSALEKNGEIKEVEQDVEIAVAQQGRAKAAAWPMGSATILAAPLPEITGDASSSNTNFGKWGPLVTGSVELALPLYTFGQLGGYQAAAEHQISANQELAKMKRSEIILKTKEYFYGYLMAKDLEKVVDNVVEFLDEAATEASKKQKSKKSKIKPHDVYKLKTELENLRQLRLEAVAGRKTAEKALGWVSVANFDKISAKKLKAEKYELQTLEQYLEMARANRPEFKALKAGQLARANLRDAKKAQSYPSVFLGGMLAFGWSPHVTDQPSLFAQDPFNQVIGGGGVGLRFDLEYSRHAAEAAEEEAQRMKLKAKESYAVPGIELQVKKAFWELEKAIEGLEIAKRRKKLARKWFISNASGWTLGITKAQDLMESLEGDALAKKAYVETVYSLNMALANLSLATGREVTNLDYISQ